MSDKPTCGILAGEPEVIGQRCADGGTCHHRCIPIDGCFRKATCVPLSASGLDNKWNVPGGESISMPAPESTWRHKNGNLYRVLCVTNIAQRREDHPPDVVYQGRNGNIFSRPLADWDRSFTPDPMGDLIESFVTAEFNPSTPAHELQQTLAARLDPPTMQLVNQYVEQMIAAHTDITHFNAVFEVECDGLTGSTSVPVKRVHREDDGAMTVVLEYWPEQPSTPAADKALCNAILRHQFQDEHRGGRLTVDVETLLNDYNQHKSAPKQPAEAVAWRQSVTKEVSCYDCRGVGSHHVSNDYSAMIVECEDCGGTGRKVETATTKTDWLKENYPSAWIMGEQLGDGPVQISQVEFDRLVQLAHTRQAIDIGKLRAENERLNAIINTPQADDFLRAVSTESEHQRQRWGNSHDAGKEPADWFWLIGYLAGKALHAHAAGNIEKAEHHVITTAAACANWHRAMFGGTHMRPGIDGEAALIGDGGERADG